MTFAPYHNQPFTCTWKLYVMFSYLYIDITRREHLLVVNEKQL